MTTQEFAQKIKQKYPVYNTIDDDELVSKITEKYPVYKQQITGYEEPTISEEPKEEKKGFLRKVGDFFTSSEQAFGKTIGGAIATVTEGKDIEENSRRNMESGDKLMELVGKTEDKEKKKQLLKSAMEAYQFAGISFQDIIPETQKTAKQIAGEGLGVALDVASFGKFGTAKAGAKTAKEAFKAGAKKFGTEGAILGGGFGVSEAMKEDKSATDILKEGATGALTGGIIGAITGGFAAKKQFNKTAKGLKLKEKAIEQYKKGLQATKEKYKEKSEKIIPQLLKDEVWGTHKKLMAKAEKGIALTRKEYEQLGKLKGMVEIDGLINMIDDEIANLTTAGGRVTSVNKARVKALNELKLDVLAVDTLDTIADKKAGQQLLRELSQQYGDELYQTRKAQKTIMDNKTLSQVKKVDSAIRNLLNTKNPKYADINKVYSLNSELAEILNETAIRKEGSKVIGLTRILSGSGGLTAGAVGAGLSGAIAGAVGMTALTEILNSTWWNTMRAVQKNRLADKLLQKSGQELNQALILLRRQGIKAVEQIINE